MKNLNYTHLHYFWTVIREGGIAPAARALHLTPQTVSGQIKLLEAQLGCPLFAKQGRRLVPTEAGQLAFGYAEEIFAKGLEMLGSLHGHRPAGMRPLTIGIADGVPKLVTWKVAEPLLSGPDPFRVICHEGSLRSLLADLAGHRVDLVLSTSTIPPDAPVKAYSHLLGQSEIGFFAPQPLARRLRKGFPASLHGAPLLMPGARSASRRMLEDWLHRNGVTPRVVGEFDDSALLKTFAQHGAGAFAAPLAIEDEIVRQFRVTRVGDATGIVARFYAISTERRIKHPGVAIITERARSDLFWR
ncbi:MAG: transcriptional activator NhaR [Gammaproteobacteria bacterium]|nr:transcriptional activator NhaR [Gammaproteobacteria bacterium]